MDQLIFSDKYRRFIIPAVFYRKIIVHSGGRRMGIDIKRRDINYPFRFAILKKYLRSGNIIPSQSTTIAAVKIGRIKKNCMNISDVFNCFQLKWQALNLGCSVSQVAYNAKIYQKPILSFPLPSPPC
jgi:hypothetical protein